MNKGIAKTISRAIREGVWLDISYDKQQLGENRFWISVNDIKHESKIIICDVYNTSIDNSFQQNWKIKYDNILSAQVIEGTYAKSNDKLLADIESNPLKYGFLEYETYQQNVLDYYLKCFKEDTIPYQEEFRMIEKIDNSVLIKTNAYQLDDKQFNQLLDLTKENIKQKEEKNQIVNRKLCINLLSIYSKRGLFSIAHREVLFDIKNRRLILDSTIKFNSEFLYGTYKKINFTNYFNFDVTKFINTFEENKLEYATILHQNLFPGERTDSSPYFFVMKREFIVNLEQVYNDIHSQKEKNILSIPLKSFFGGMSQRNLGRKKYPILLLDKRVNIDQLRVIYNSLNNPVTFVQGPPGTGKTQTILNVILSTLYNGMTVLVTSNNNQPIDNILSNLLDLHYKGNVIPLPVLRLGNNESVKQTICQLNDYYWKYADQLYDNISIMKIEKWLGSNSDLLTILNDYEEYEQKEEEIVALKKLYKKTKDQIRSIGIFDRIQGIQRELDLMQVFDNDIIVSKLQVDEDILSAYLFHSSIKNIRKLNEKKYSDIKKLIIFNKDIEVESKHVRKFKKILQNSEALKLIQEIFPIMLTTNLSSGYIGPNKPTFDLVVMDEAGQCNPATSLIPISRGKRLLLVGDTNQLQPIVSIEEKVNEKLLRIFKVSKAYNYKENSILHIMQSVDRISKFILLKYHYRCAPKIIQFSNQKYYGKELIVETNPITDSLKLINVKSKNDSKNVSSLEIASIISEIKVNKSKNIGVITPFRAQAKEIEKRLKEFNLDHVSVGTIHTFQGDEKEKIIFSLGVTKSTHLKTFDWIKNNVELINVATTRAKKQFVMVCDREQVIKQSNTGETNGIYELMEYVKNNGEYILSDESTDTFKQGIHRGKKLHSVYEEEFLNTVEQVLSLNEGLKIESKMRVADVLSSIDIAPEDIRYFLQSHFDFVVYSRISNLPKLAIEINGMEHYLEESVRLRDDKKKKICMENGLKLLIIPNEYVRRYELIKDEMMKILK